jgi:hypothetical protein
MTDIIGLTSVDTPLLVFFLRFFAGCTIKRATNKTEELIIANSRYRVEIGYDASYIYKGDTLVLRVMHEEFAKGINRQNTVESVIREKLGL